MRCPESGGDTLDAARALPQRIQLKLPRVRRKPLEFIVSPLTSRARSRRRVGRQFRVRYEQRLRRLARALAAVRSTELQPIHFIDLIAAAVSNRGPNLLGGMRKHYRM